MSGLAGPRSSGRVEEIRADLREIRGGLVSRVRRLVSMAARATALPLLVRALVGLAAVAATVLAWPADLLLGATGLVVLGIAALPALAPRTPVVGAVVLLTVVGWLVATGAYDEPVTLWRLVAVAWALYLVHSTAALAAHLPYDAIVAPGVLLRWFARTGIVLAATVVVAVAVLALSYLPRGRAFEAATLVGFAVAVGVAALLARLVRRG
jgi:hypothetical protein